MKKLFGIILTATVFCAVFTACSSDPLKVAIVSYGSKVEDGHFNELSLKGFRALDGNYEISTGHREADGDYQALLKDVAQTNKLVFAANGLKADEVISVARTYADTSFIVNDVDFDDILTEEEKLPENLAGICYRAEEAAFLAGYAAACASKTNTVGFIGGIEALPEIGRIHAGFLKGVAFADKERDDGKKTVTHTLYTDSFDDEDKAKESADSVYAAGADVIMHAAGKAGDGVIASAKSNGMLVIGMDENQKSLAPDNVLGSAVKYVGEVIDLVMQDYHGQTALFGKTHKFGIAEGGVSFVPNSNVMDKDLAKNVTYHMLQIIAGGYESMISGLE